jgi:hypothetical protein
LGSDFHKGNHSHFRISFSFFQVGYNLGMNIRPAPPVPGKTESERMDHAARTIFTVSKEEMARREAEWQKTHGKPRPKS